MGVSAVDIITYIGIPLAVLGVLPTIYTCLKSYLTLRAITQSLSSNSVTAITRSALLSGIIEIEIPRRSLQPLPRSDPRYFGLNHAPSRLRGGSWTLFHWQEMAIGVKSYRVQYHDELVQPQAEIDFEGLVAFLLDRGAVPRKEGWADLKSKGLWTPAGTRLLVWQETGEEVLSVSLSDDSDGILSLGVGWRGEWGGRGEECLPPYWVRVRVPQRKEEYVLAAEDKRENTEVEGGEGGDMEKQDVELGYRENEKNDSSPALRLRISASGVQEAHFESPSHKNIPLLHLRSIHSSNSTIPFWFAIAATAFQTPLGGLWSFSIPSDILSLSRRETVPCGIMVLLGTMTDEEVPTWRTPHDEQAERFEKHVKFTEQARRMNEEARLPPDQRDAARRKRLETEAIDFHNDVRRRRMKEEQRREADITEALQSQKLPISVLAEKNRAWLLAHLALSESLTMTLLVEQVLYGMTQHAGFAARIAAMLDLWRSWSTSGGMTKSHFLAVREDQVAFALASSILCVVRNTVSEPTGSMVSDLQECLRMWKKVRLG